MFEKLHRQEDYILIFRQNISADYFNSLDQCLQFGDDYNGNLFSALTYLDSFVRDSDNKIQFKLYYPSLNKTYIWKQSTNFATDTSSVSGYEAISIDDPNFIGLEYSDSSYVYAVGSNDGNNNFSIGCLEGFGPKLKAAGSDRTDIVELYVYCPESHTVDVNGFYSNHLNESGAINYNFKIVGNGSNTKVNNSSVKLNNIEYLTSQYLKDSGLALVVFNPDFTLSYRACYSTTTDTSITSFKSKIESLTNEIYCISSMKTFIDSPELNSIFIDTLGSSQWKGSGYQYACIGRADMGIIQEACIYDSKNMELASLEYTVDEYDNFGSNGYGLPISESYEGDSPTLDPTSINLNSGQRLLYCLIAEKIDSSIASDIVTITYSDNSTDTITIDSVGFKKKYEGYITPPNDITTIAISSTSTNTNYYAFNIYKSSVSSPIERTKLIFNPEIAPFKKIVESPVDASLLNDDEIIDLANSSANLLGSFGDTLTPSVNFGEQMVSTGYGLNGTSQSTDPLSINQYVPFALMIWINTNDKSDGSFSITVNPDSGNITQYNGSSETSDIELLNLSTFNNPNKWVLYTAFFVPSYNSDLWDLDQFYNKYNKFFGNRNSSDSLNNNNNGIGIGENNVYSFNSDVSTLTFSFNDVTGSNGSTTIICPYFGMIKSASVSSEKLYTLNVIRN